QQQQEEMARQVEAELDRTVETMDNLTRELVAVATHQNWMQMKLQRTLLFQKQQVEQIECSLSLSSSSSSSSITPAARTVSSSSPSSLSSSTTLSPSLPSTLTTTTSPPSSALTSSPSNFRPLPSSNSVHSMVRHSQEHAHRGHPITSSSGVQHPLEDLSRSLKQVAVSVGKVIASSHSYSTVSSPSSRTYSTQISDDSTSQATETTSDTNTAETTDTAMVTTTTTTTTSSSGKTRLPQQKGNLSRLDAKVRTGIKNRLANNDFSKYFQELEKIAALGSKLGLGFGRVGSENDPDGFDDVDLAMDLETSLEGREGLSESAVLEQGGEEGCEEKQQEQEQELQQEQEQEQEEAEEHANGSLATTKTTASSSTALSKSVSPPDLEDFAAQCRLLTRALVLPFVQLTHRAMTSQDSVLALSPTSNKTFDSPSEWESIQNPVQDPLSMEQYQQEQPENDENDNGEARIESAFLKQDRQRPMGRTLHHSRESTFHSVHTDFNAADSDSSLYSSPLPSPKDSRRDFTGLNASHASHSWPRWSPGTGTSTSTTHASTTTTTTSTTTTTPFRRLSFTGRDFDSIFRDPKNGQITLDSIVKAKTIVSTGLYMIHLLYWTLLFIIGSLVLDPWLAETAGQQVIQIVDQVREVLAMTSMEGDVDRRLEGENQHNHHHHQQQYRQESYQYRQPQFRRLEEIDVNDSNNSEEEEDMDEDGKISMRSNDMYDRYDPNSNDFFTLKTQSQHHDSNDEDMNDEDQGRGQVQGQEHYDGEYAQGSLLTTPMSMALSRPSDHANEKAKYLEAQTHVQALEDRAIEVAVEFETLKQRLKTVGLKSRPTSGLWNPGEQQGRGSTRTMVVDDEEEQKITTTLVTSYDQEQKPLRVVGKTETEEEEEEEEEEGVTAVTTASNGVGVGGGQGGLMRSGSWVGPRRRRLHHTTKDTRRTRRFSSASRTPKPVFINVSN
ncbi:hypothetical protein BGZ94_004019, partial [Podila epigama]